MGSPASVFNPLESSLGGNHKSDVSSELQRPSLSGKVVLVESSTRPSRTNEEIIVQEAPFHLIKTHFICAFKLDGIVSTVEKTLSDNIDFAYEFVANECLWKVMYYQGASKCRFQVVVYSGNTDNTYIVEVQKLTSGEGVLFREVFNNLKNQLSVPDNSSVDQETGSLLIPSSFDSPSSEDNGDSGFLLAPCDDPATDISDDEVVSCLAAIVRMGRQPSLEAKELAANMLLDISMHEGLEQLVCESEALNLLTEMLNDDKPIATGPVNGETQATFITETAKHSAVLAMANISESLAAQTYILESGALNAVIGLASNGTYDTVEVRRECARIFANLASRLTSQVTSAVNPQVLESWLTSVDGLEDERLRMHADRARIALTGY
jgi:hypothetical protein